ncbi:hypothetical protein D0Y65_046645 [Glycine soja]|uniref:Uncharacterized protein n=1 Tax=Glycine soja TaxID=3848 RepID=A0A445GA55_GLYSO|nr:hypothetical protein D0Y65_046645 [Glycine soja]
MFVSPLRNQWILSRLLRHMKPKTTTRYFIIQVKKHETFLVLLLSISVKKKKKKSCGKGFVHILNAMHSVRFMSSPIGVTVTVPNNARPCNRISCIRVKASMVDSSSDFVKRMELAWSISQFPLFNVLVLTLIFSDHIIVMSLVVLFSTKNMSVLYRLHQIIDFYNIHHACSNQCQLRVHLATLKGILNVNGVEALVSSLLVTMCFVKFHPETLAVLFAEERDQGAVLIVKEQAFVQSG